MGPEAPLLVALGAAFTFVAAQIVKQVIAREYDSWAPALARAIVRLAGRLHPARAREWLADVLYLQHGPEAQTGLWEAACHLLAAPRLTGRSAARTLLRRLASVVAGRVVSEHPRVLGVGSHFLGEGIDRWINMRSDEAGYDDDLAQTIKMVAEWLALDKLRVVTFVRDPDGAVRGMTAHGDRQAGTIVRATIYEQEPRRFRQRHARLFLADDEHMRALQNLADTSENFGVEQWKDDVMTVAFRQDAGAFERCSEYSHPEHRAYARASPLVDISPTPVRRTLDRLRLIPGARKR